MKYDIDGLINNLSDKSLKSDSQYIQDKFDHHIVKSEFKKSKNDLIGSAVGYLTIGTDNRAEPVKVVINGFRINISHSENRFNFSGMVSTPNNDTRYLRGSQAGNNFFYRAGQGIEGRFDQLESEESELEQIFIFSFKLATRGKVWKELFKALDVRVLDYLGYDPELSTSPSIACFNVESNNLNTACCKIAILCLVVESCLYESSINRMEDASSPNQTEVSDNSISNPYDKFKEFCNIDTSDEEFELEQFDKSIVMSAIAALKMGKHIIFSGPAGSGKSTLALKLAKYWLNVEMREKLSDRLEKPIMCTASPAWSYGDLIARYIPRKDGDGLEVEDGFLLTALSEKMPLVIDEINRANIESCFGELYTLMAGQGVTLPFKNKNSEGELKNINIHYGAAPQGDDDSYVFSKKFRIIGTMNDKDRTVLHDLSFAMLRRFFIINIKHPEAPRKTLKALIKNEVCGPSTIREVERFVLEYKNCADDDGSEIAARQIALTHFIIPMLDVVDGADLGTMSEIFESMFGYIENNHQGPHNSPESEILKKEILYKYRDSFYLNDIARILKDM